MFHLSSMMSSEICREHDLAKKGGMKSPARIRVGVCDAALKLEGVARIGRRILAVKTRLKGAAELPVRPFRRGPIDDSEAYLPGND